MAQEDYSYQVETIQAALEAYNSDLKDRYASDDDLKASFEEIIKMAEEEAEALTPFRKLVITSDLAALRRLQAAYVDAREGAAKLQALYDSKYKQFMDYPTKATIVLLGMAFSVGIVVGYALHAVRSLF